MTRHFSHKIEIFFKEIIIDGPLRKTKYYAIGISFKKGVARLLIRSYGFLMHQILNMKLPILSLLRKK